MPAWSGSLTKEQDQRLMNLSSAMTESHKAKRHSRPFAELSFQTKRKVVLEEQEDKCKKCGISEWLGKPLTLEIDHKDGNRENNVRDNLEGLCPNCHSQTPTWRSKNRKQKHSFKQKVSDQLLIEALKTEPTIAHALRKVGMVGKGANYYRAKKLLGSVVQ